MGEIEIAFSLLPGAYDVYAEFKGDDTDDDACKNAIAIAALVRECVQGGGTVVFNSADGSSGELTKETFDEAMSGGLLEEDP